MQATVPRSTTRRGGLTWLLRLVLAFAGVSAVGLLTGIPQHLYHLGYDALAYPLVSVGAAIRGINHPGAAAVGWDAWMRDPERTFTLLQTPRYGSMQGALLFEFVIVMALPAAAGWRVTWFLVTRLGRIEPGAPHGSARWMSDREMRRPGLPPGIAAARAGRPASRGARPRAADDERSARRPARLRQVQRRSSSPTCCASRARAAWSSPT